MSLAVLSTPRFWAVIPAAGTGSRMGAAVPKQYLSLCGQTVLTHTVARLAGHPLIHSVTIVVAPDDVHFQKLAFSAEKIRVAAVGGDERCHSVSNGLKTLPSEAKDDDWVMIHDAARPCVRVEDISCLIEELRDHRVGGLLGLPVTDTVKRTDNHGNVLATVQRNGLWRALTPQMFRLGLLRDALKQALGGGLLVTDEAQAMEAAGHVPRMIEGHTDNIKITRPQDLALAELYLQQQERA